MSSKVFGLSGVTWRNGLRDGGFRLVGREEAMNLRRKGAGPFRGGT